LGQLGSEVMSKGREGGGGAVGRLVMLVVGLCLGAQRRAGRIKVFGGRPDASLQVASKLLGMREGRG
jgi:hypothetical protein